MIHAQGRTAAAAALCAASLFVFAHALIGAIHVDVPVAPNGTTPPDTPFHESVGPGLNAEALLLAADNDPFQPDRQRPGARYRMPGDVDPQPPPEPPPAPQVPDFRLSGTTLSAAGAAALIQVGDAVPRMVAVGDHLLGYRLDRVTPTSAVLSGAAGDVLLQMPAPPQRIAAQPPNASRQQRPPQRGPANGTSAAQIQQMLERARQSGASPQVLEALMRQLQERGVELEAQAGGGMIFRAQRPPPPDTTSRRTPDTP